MATNLEANSSNINKMAVIDSDSAEHVFSHLNHFSLQAQHHHILTLLAHQLHTNDQASITSCIKEVYDLLFAKALKVNQHLLDHDILTILQDY